MLLNSAFPGFFTNRWAMAPVIAIAMLAIFFMGSSFKEGSDRDLRAKQTNLMIRQIGHQLLLQAGDSTSRVLPVTETEEGRFLLKFENEFVFDHDSLIVLTQKLLPKTQFSSGYTVTVHDCLKGGIVYGFQRNNDSPDILACSGRSQPLGCYNIEFVFPDLYASAEQKKAQIDTFATSGNVDGQKIHSKLEQFNTAIVDKGIESVEKFKSARTDPREINSKPEEFKMTILDYPLTNVMYIGLLVLLGIALSIWRFGKILKPALAEHQHQAAIIEESIPEFPALGKFLFNAKGQRLLLGNEVVNLTDKECKVLELLHKNFGELVSRETLLQEVWINEGVITGRSLDMFVSKLRKKLSRDPDLSITNVHGKGYVLEIHERHIQ